MNRAVFAAVVVAGVLAGVGVANHFWRRGETPPPLEHATAYPESRMLPAFQLVDQRGAPFDRERLQGRWTFLFFGFVNCPDICPMTLATLVSAQKSLADLPEAEQPGVVLVSVDPG